MLVLVKAVIILAFFQGSVCLLNAQFRSMSPYNYVGNFNAGMMVFNQMSESQSETFKQVARPMFLLSISQLIYETPIELRLNRDLKKTAAGSLVLTVNASVQNHFSKPKNYSMTVMYLLTQQLSNIDLQTVNLTTRDWDAKFRYSSTPSNTTGYIHFLVGFSNPMLTQSVKLVIPLGHDQEFIYIFSDQLKRSKRFEWIQIVVVVLDLFRNCPNGSLEIKSELRVVTNPLKMGRYIGNFRDSLFYMVGLTAILLDKISFTYYPENHLIESTNETWLTYGVLGLNLSCVVGTPVQIPPNTLVNQTPNTDGLILQSAIRPTTEPLKPKEINTKTNTSVAQGKFCWRITFSESAALILPVFLALTYGRG